MQFIHHIIAKLSADSCYKYFHFLFLLGTISIHFCIIVLILSRNDRLPPLTVIQIPLDCLLDTIGKLCLRKPSKLTVDLCWIDRITHIVALTVSDICDQTLRLAKFFTNNLNNINVGHLIVTTSIIYFTDSALMNDQVNSTAMILYIQPVTDIFSLAVYRKRLIIQRICDHQRDQFLRKMVWSIVVRAAADRYRQTVCAVICQY